MDPNIEHRLSHLHSISALVSACSGKDLNSAATFYGQVLHGVAGDVVELAEPIERKYCLACQTFLVVGQNCRFALVPLKRSMGGFKRSLKRQIVSSFDNLSLSDTKVFGMKELKRKRDKNLLAYHCFQCKCITVRPGFDRKSFHALAADKPPKPADTAISKKPAEPKKSPVQKSTPPEKKHKKSNSLKKMIKQAQSKPSSSGGDFSLEDFFS